jgi:hypothetical protein
MDPFFDAFCKAALKEPGEGGVVANTASLRLYGPPSWVLVALALAILPEMRFMRVRSAVRAEELISIEVKKSIFSLSIYVNNPEPT